MKYLFVLYALLLGHSLFASLSYPDFIISMTRKKDATEQYKNYLSYDLSQYQEILEESLHIENLRFFQNCYKQNIDLAQDSNGLYRIPRIVHQIWLGSKVPAKYKTWMNSWMNWMGWEYKLWTDEDVEHLSLYNQKLYDQATNYGEKSDILRLELLEQFGGLYVDTDFECINSNIFNVLNRSFDFYVGFEPSIHGSINHINKICNALMASAPNHPLIKNLIVNMEANWLAHNHETAIQKCGPDYLSRSILDYEKNILVYPASKERNSEYRNMYLPCSFFYPFSSPEIRKATSYEDLLSKAAPETAAIHYWSGSWLPQRNRPDNAPVSSIPSSPYE